MVLTISTDPLNARFSLAPFDEWLAAFHIDCNRYQIEAQYYSDGVPDSYRHLRQFDQPTAGVRASLGRFTNESPSVPVSVSGTPYSSPPDDLATDTITTGQTEVPLDDVANTVTQLMTWIDPTHDFTVFPVPPLRSPTAHAQLQQMNIDRDTHARRVVEQLSPPVEALVPLETGHRILGVESLGNVTDRGELDNTTTWECYNDQLRPGECLGIHLTRATQSQLETLRERGFDRREAVAPTMGIADARWNVLHCWLHTPDIGTWHGLTGNISVVAIALPRPYTLVGSYTVASDGTRLTYETELLLEYNTYRTILEATPTALAPTHTPDTLLGTG